MQITVDIYIYIYIQAVSRLVDITAGGDFLGLCDQRISFKPVSDFARLRSYGHFLIPVHALLTGVGCLDILITFVFFPHSFPCHSNFKFQLITLS